jgi:hypothetical protein
MTDADDHFGRHPKRWTITVVNWTLENPDHTARIALGLEIEDPAKEIESTHTLESAEAPDLEAAIAKAHELLDRHKEHVGEFALEVYISPPLVPHPEQARLGVRDFKLTPEARQQARAIGLRGRDIEQRISRLARHAVRYEHKHGTHRFGGILLRLEGDTVTWVGLAVPPRRRRRKAK